MPVFLSDEWVDALGAATRGVEVPATAAIALRQVVDGISWTVRVGDGRVTVDRAVDADVTLTTDRATAIALVQGELAAQDAFASGRLRLTGSLATLLDNADGLAGLDAVFAGVRSSTTYA